MRFTTTAVLCLLLAGTVDAAAPADPTPELEAWLQAYREHYNRQDYESLLRMWDKDEPNVIYMAEEIDPAMRGWPLLRAYFNPRPGVQVLDGILNHYSKVRAHMIAPDLAFATYQLDFTIQVKGQRPMTSWDRVTAVFRRRGEEWKMISYVESPMAPLTMVRKMMQRQVPDDFDEFVKAQPKAIPPEPETP
ncbi:MAG: nuclear transport factor 2 family protein [Gammaproteobacteria bacterium]|nr:nuclear transport factor 2 family protein [Gammaproteobacteria bacterium]